MLSFWLVAAELCLAANPALSYEDVLSRIRPAPEEAEVRVELAAARHLLAETTHGLAEGPTLGVTAGPRWSSEATRSDLAADLDWPFLPRASGRGELAAALATAEGTLPAAARLEQRLRLALAYVEAWNGARLVELRREDLATVERWQAITARRAEAGAAAGFESDLAAVEVERAWAALVLAESEVLRTWGELTLLADLPPEPQALAEPLPADPAPASSTGVAPTGLLRRAIDARRVLAESTLRLEEARSQSRLALRSGLAREGEENVARLGLGYRWPRPGERQAVARTLDARREALAREAERAGAELDRRIAAARALAGALASQGAPLDLSRAFAALELRLTEGKASPAEILTLRRGLLAAQESRLENDAARWRALLELAALTTEEAP